LRPARRTGRENASRSRSGLVFKGDSEVESSDDEKETSRNEKTEAKHKKDWSDTSSSASEDKKRHKDQEKDRVKDREKDREKEREKEKEKEKERDREKDKEKEKEREKDRERDRDRDRDRDKKRDKDRRTSKGDDSRSPSHRKHKHRSRSGKHNRSSSSRSRSRGKDKKRRETRSRSRSKKQKDRGRKDRRSESSRSRTRSRERARDRSKEKERDRDREKEREKDRKEKERARDRSRSARKEREKEKQRSRSAPRRGRGGFDQQPVQEASFLQMQAMVVRQQPPNSLLSMLAETSASTMALPSSPEVEAFLAQNPVEPHAASRLRSLPPEMQRLVIERGSLFGARDPSAVLISRVRDATMGGAQSMGLGVPAPPPVNVGNVHHGVEMLIARYNLDARCAQMLRSLPPDRQQLAADLPVHEARNPSAFVMAQLQLPHFQLGPQMAQMMALPVPGMGQPPPPPPPGQPPPSSMFQVL